MRHRLAVAALCLLPTGGALANHCSDQTSPLTREARRLKEMLQGSVSLVNSQGICEHGRNYVRYLDRVMVAIRKIPKDCYHRKDVPLERIYARERAQKHELSERHCRAVRERAKKS
jgi:hypothetical protein